MNKIFGNPMLFLAVILMTVMASCTPKEMTVKGDEDVEGEFNNLLSLSTDSLYSVSFEKSNGKYFATTTLQLEADAVGDYKEVGLTAAIVDSDDDPLCEFSIKTDSGKEKLINLLRKGEGKVKVKFISSESLSENEVEKVMENGRSIRIIASEGTLNKTPEQIKAEQDSIARASVPALEITDFLGSKRSESGFAGKVRDLNDGKKIISALESKGFSLDKNFKVRAQEYDGEWTQMQCYELSRSVGSMTETVIIHEWPDMYIEINFCDNTAAHDYMAKMTSDGYRDGVSSDCYYSGSRVERSGKKVTLYQIWEP